jgi:hypothetical protein
MNETHIILIRFLRLYIPWNWELGSTLAKLCNFWGGGGSTPKPPFGTPLQIVVLDAANHSRRRIQGFTHHRRGRRFFLVSNIFQQSAARAKLINSIPTLNISITDILKASETN